jgi:acetate kinase
MNMDAHLSSMMSKEMSDLFQTEIIKSLNDITLNGQRKIIAARKYGNSIAVTLEAYKSSPKTAYSFGLASKLSEVVLDEVKKDSRCKKHGVSFDYINGNTICPICEK